MLNHLPTRDRRAILLGAFILLPSLGWAWGARPFFAALNERRELAAREQDLLSRERALVAEAPRVPAELAAAQKGLVLAEARAVRSDAAVTASVKFADYVREIARANEVLVTQASEQPADSLAAGVLSVRLAVRGESDLGGILRFVRALEGGTLRARVATLHIERSRRAPEDAREVLSVNVVIEAPAIIAPATIAWRSGSER